MPREPLYRSRPVGPDMARFGGQGINDFIALSEGASNSYLVMTEAGNIQINAGMGFEAPVHRRNFAEFSPDKLRYLILTQGHVDHVGGVDYFREHNPGLEVIAQANNAEHQAYDARLRDFRVRRSAFAFTDKFAAAFQHYSENGYTDYPEQSVPTADITFSERHSFTLGGLDVDCIAVAGAETNDSLVVWLPEQRICFTGNLFGCPFGHFPNLSTIRGDRYRDALTCAAAVETVRELEPALILYGHHGPVEGADLIQEELERLRDAILYVHDETVKGMNAGADVHSLMRDIRLPPALEVGEGYGSVPWGVRSIWEHYGGWFHQRATSELYAASPNDIHADLLELMGGEAALVQRAQQKLAEGEALAALQLLEIALSGANPDSGVLQAARAAHQALRKDSNNFWLDAWLDHQIARLTERLAAGDATDA
ncbi:MAG: MBL fold metallo-hydrolase [Halieaceae bacterium]|nr:MBL fold metallo-hydrolase [Halieaceae bacterium]